MVHEALRDQITYKTVDILFNLSHILFPDRKKIYFYFCDLGSPSDGNVK